MNRIGRLETTLLLIGILLIGACFRFVGLNWGEGQHIHPDEEFLRQVTAAVRWPDQPGLYLDTAHSPLSPYNQGYSFFVYGTVPLFLTRAVAEGLERGCTGSEVATLQPTRLLAPLLLGVPAQECWPGSFTGSRMVGRALAALFDLGSIVFVFLAGRRLGSRWTGLLGSSLYALAALPIQQAHFYTVDAFANFFVTAALYLTIRAAQSGGWVSFALAGLSTGLGVACKISVWPLGLLVGLGGLLWWGGARAGAGSNSPSTSPPGGVPGPRRPGLLGLVARVALAGGIALLAFRLAQPYTFMGPGLFGLRLNPQWLANMAEIRHLMSGTVDTYPGHQWTARTPVLFPWVNITFWGLGLPLGLVTWTAWAVAGLDLVRCWCREGRTALLRPPVIAMLLLWLWGTGYFLYQGTQWVKSSRYLLPIYPALLLLAAWLTLRLMRWAWAPARRARALAVAVAALALGGALCWALAMIPVYARPHTRIASSRWIFEHIPTAATVHLDHDGQPAHVHVPFPADMLYREGGPRSAPFRVAQEGELNGVTLNYVRDSTDDAVGATVHVAVAADAAGQVVLAEVTAAVSAPLVGRGAPCAFSLPPVRVTPDNTYYLIVELLDGGPLQLRTSTLATEHWDWPPPLRVDGRDPYGGMYQGFELPLYYDDTAEKRENLLTLLDEADYIITGSNRLYGSIPRLPTRYPLTMAYYQALFNGELGFELLADFTSFPALGPFQFPDQEEPFPVPEAAYQYRTAPIDVPMPPAEEAFSVYDHPRVLIFRKTAAYSRAQAEALLSPSLLQNVVWVTPRQQTRGVREAVFDSTTWAQQRTGGTWSAMFDRHSPLNRSSGLAALAWYLAATLLGWLAFPLLFLALPRLADRGYGLARALGLLLVGYLTWLAASLRWLPHSRSTLALVVVLLAVAGGVAVWRQWGEWRDFLRRRWAVLLVHEGLFALLFVAWAWVRVLNPDLWHPVVGGEKPMDFAYLNAVIRSTWFPPYDPWFAGGYINYYYFGFVLVGALAKLLGIMPSVAYNLALPLFYAITGGAAFCVAFNLVDRANDGHWTWSPYAAGLLAVLFVLVLGNLGEIRLLINGFRAVAGEPPFPSTIPGLPELVQTLRGLGMVAQGTRLPFRPETPYWEPTRMIPVDSSGVGPITEFPACLLYTSPSPRDS